MSEASTFTGTIDCSNKNISALSGIEYFKEITGLDCSYNKLTALNVSINSKLINLNCGDNNSPSLGISALDLTKNVNLETLDCGGNNLTVLNIKQNPKLNYLDCSYNNLMNIDVNLNTSLSYLDCSSNQLVNIDVSKNINLVHFFSSYNPIKQLDVSKNLVLSRLGCFDNQLTSLDVSKNVLLKILGCSDNNIATLDVSQNPLIEMLYCYNNNLTKLDVSKNPKLGDFFPLPNYQLEKLNLKNGNNVRPNFWIVPDTQHALAPKLFCVEVDDVNWYYQNAPYLLDYIGQGAVYSTNCNLTLATNQTQKSQIKIYPNPVKNSLNIQTEAKLQKVEIYSANGQLVKTSFIKETNVAKLPKGNYVAKITTNKGVQTEKIIKE